MGYYTHFQLSALPRSVDVDELFNETVEYCGCYDGRVNHGEGMKWYSHDHDMVALSKKYPTVVFILDGEGEEAGDLWRKFYVNGEIETHRPEPWDAPARPKSIEMPVYVPEPAPRVLHVPHDHILHSALDGKMYEEVDSFPDTTIVTVDGSTVTVPNAWLEEPEDLS